MNRTSRPIDVLHAMPGLIVLLACASARAGEPLPPISKNPTMAFACMAAAGNIEYDSTAFVTKNPGPVYADLEKHAHAMNRAFEAYLEQKYGFSGYSQCGQHDTLAEAKQWLVGRQENQVGRNYKLVQTDWTYSGSVSASAAPTPPPPAAQPAAASRSATAFYVCTTITKDAVYDNELFEAAGDGATNRQVYFSHGIFVAENFGNGVWHQCAQKPSLAEAQKYQQQVGAGRNLPRKTTHWVYNAEPTASTAQPTTTTYVATAIPTKPASPPMTTPKPSVPPPVAATVAPKLSAPATGVAPQGTFVVCNAVDLASGRRLYNLPLQIASGDYPEWMVSYRDYVKANYKFDRNVRCSKFPTLAAAQSYHKEITDTAKLTTEINGKPAPLITTNWKYP